MGSSGQCQSKIDYLRISVTDRCNQRCFYCMQENGLQLFKPGQILTFEEILAVSRAAAESGFRKFRLTGGEPLVRRNICDLIRRMAGIQHIEEIVMTTNGVLLTEAAAALHAAGLRRLNISLDTLNPLKYRKITKRNFFHRVMDGIACAEAAGFDPIKINVVVIRGVNDDELEAFARWSMQTGRIVRFIEFMPIGSATAWRPERFISIEEMRERLERLAPLRPVGGCVSDGPAQRLRLGSTGAEIGLIGALSSHFCSTCNRLRLTAEGSLRPCLRSDEEIDVKAALRSGCDQKELVRLVQSALQLKTGRHRSGRSKCRRPMSRIGG